MSRPTPSPTQRSTTVILCLVLAVITLAVFGQTVRFDFVNFDDNCYVYDNSTVTNGLTLHGINSAFTQPKFDNWVPLTTLSHMVDYQFYGLDAGGHHLTNLLLHICSVILLFLVLRQMTGALWRSAFVAVIFAVQPLHVESVAWISERKDTLSGLFFMLVLLAYVHYVRRPDSLPRYLLVLFLFALGLLSKPMLVTLPFVLLLLDYWPLNRFAAAPTVELEPIKWLNRLSVPARLIVEKIPLLVLVLACSIMTTLAEKHSIQTVTTFSLPLRVENAMISYVTFLWQLFYPVGLAPFYPYPANPDLLWKALVAALVLTTISAAVFFWRRERPYLIVGWLWYLGMLAPVIGIFVQEGAQQRADRHTYLPLIGLGLMLAWLAVDVFAGWRNRRSLLGGLAAVATGGWMSLAWMQTAYWKNSEALWTHTLSVTSNNVVACNNLGDALVQKKEFDAAIRQFQLALAINTNSAQAYNNLGNALTQKGIVDEAIVDYQKALSLSPDDADICYNLGIALLQKDRSDEAIIQFQKVLASNPDFAQAHFNLGNCLLQKGEVDEATGQFQSALEINPGYAQAHDGLGNALLRKGRVDDAIIEYQRALAIHPNFPKALCDLGDAFQLKGQMEDAIGQYRDVLKIAPDNIEALNNNAWLLATCPDASLRNGQEAVADGEKACALTHYNAPMLVGTLAAAYAEAGRFSDAITAAQKAETLATRDGLTSLATKNQQLLKLYQAGQAYHEAQPQ